MITVEGRLVVDGDVEVLVGALVAAHAQLTRELWRRCVRGDESFENPPVVSRELQARGWSSTEAKSAFHAAQDAQATAVKTARWASGDLRERLTVAERRLARAKASKGKRAQCHGLARRRDRLASRLERLEADVAGGRVSPSWGGRKLFAAQHEAGAPGARHVSHEQWLGEWRSRRDGGTVFEGQRDSRAGNPGAQIILDPGRRRDGTLRLRIPTFLRHLSGGESWVEIPVKGLAHGRAHLEAALADDRAAIERRAAERERRGLARNPNPKTPRRGPVTVRLHERAGKWFVGASVQRYAAPAVISDKANGAVGVDVNADHLAVCLVSSDGNPVAWRRIDYDLAGTSDQRANQIGEAVAAALELAVEHHVPVVVEKLDFTRKRAELRNLPRAQRRGLSSFAYAQILDALRWGCVERGLARVEVSPAFTSVLGQANYAHPHGVSVDLASACVIARRGLGFGDRVRPRVTRTGPVRSCFGHTRDGRVQFLLALARTLPPRRRTHGSEWLARAPHVAPDDPFGPPLRQPSHASQPAGRRAQAPRVAPVVGAATSTESVLMLLPGRVNNVPRDHS